MARAERTRQLEPRADEAAAPRAARRRTTPALRRRRLARASLYVVAVLMSLWVLAPIYLITVTAFTPRRRIFDFPKQLIPTHVSAETVDFFARSSGVLSALGTSVMVALITLVMATAIG